MTETTDTTDTTDTTALDQWSPDDRGDGTLLAPGERGETAEDEGAGTEAASTVWLRRTVDAGVLAVCVLFLLLQLQPGLLVSDTTPSGGDMGAHVWGPAYLRDHLLPNLQLAGWTPDWYAGFPAFQFYMVVPSLLIVLLDVGVHGPLALIPAAMSLGLAIVAVRRRHQPRLRNLAIAGSVVAFGLVGLPYGVAFKWVSVSGVLALPICAYVFGRLSGLRFPTPALLAVATLPFLFYRGFTIYGGNIPSTLAGEFAFSMSLGLAFLYLGVVFRGLETGRHRAWAAVLLALCGLCHLIPAIWVIGATGVVVLVRFHRSRAPAGPCAAFVIAGSLFALAGLLLGGPSDSTTGLGLVLLGIVVAAWGAWLASESVRWLTPVFVVAGLLAAFWVGPFYLRRTYLNDMGWEKLPGPDVSIRDMLLSGDSAQSAWRYLLPSQGSEVDLRWVFALALVGAGLSLALRVRAGIFLTLVTLGAGIGFVLAPQGRLWNARLLPFYYLTAALLAAIAVSEVIRTIVVLATGRDRPFPRAGAMTALGGLAATLLVVGLPLGALPFDERTVDEQGNANGYAWPAGLNTFHAGPQSFIPSWAKWNYRGYEGKDAYREYYEIVRTMDGLGRDQAHGCGRAFWEYEPELDRYGTPMALMLLPYWTDGCIGSMEGLYFEASSTTPYHFLMQTELSAKPSAAQRDMPYGAFDIGKGVDHLQLMGVRYYMATSEQAVQAARAERDLTEVASSGPWVVFEVADSSVIEALPNEPAVLDGIDDSSDEWLRQPRDVNGRFNGPSVAWFNDPSRWDVMVASSGPDDWQRVAPGVTPEAQPVDVAEISNPDVSRDGISFDVDRVGTPVLVKVSYFPNWRADGADGPYRVAPNLMVVVPTDTHVELTYGRTGVEWLSFLLTGLGVVGLIVLAKRPPFRFREPAHPDPGVLGPSGRPSP